jgi:Serine incorporator (Serinc)
MQLLDSNCGPFFVPVTATLTVLAVAGALVMMGLLYASFAPNASCARNICFITFTLIICLLLFGLTTYAVQTHPGGLCHTNFFTIGMLCPYFFWLCATALASSPAGQCSPCGADQGRWYAVRSSQSSA